MADASASRLPRTWFPALLISIIVSAFCAAALYVLLAQHDRSLVAQRNASAVLAAEYSARATARTMAWFTQSMAGENFAAIQQTLEQHAQQANLLSAAVIMEDNVVVASSNPAAMQDTFGSTMHGSGRTMSRAQAKRTVRGEQLLRDMKHHGILVKAVSMSGLAEEAGLAYKNISDVVNTVDQAGITKKVAELKPIGNIKG